MSTNFLSPKHGHTHLPPLPPAPKHAEPKKRFTRRTFVRNAKRVLYTSLTVLVLFLATGVAAVGYGVYGLKSAQSEAETALETGDLTLADSALTKVIRSLRSLNIGLSMYSFLEPVPFIGEQVEGGIATVHAALETAEALQSGLSILHESMDAVAHAGSVITGAEPDTESHLSYDELTPDEKLALWQSLASALPELRKMQVKLRLAERDLARLEDLDLHPAFAKAVEPLQEHLPELVDAVDVIVPFAAIAPEFAGLGEDRQFLLLFLNNDEIRPGGGFIGVYGLLLMRDGDMQSLVTDDSYKVDAYVQGRDDYYVNPPPPLKSWLIPEWYFRDSAWAPDFGQTSRDAVQLFRQELAYGGQPVPEIHGVVGITPTFISRVLDFVGPITVEGQTFTSENFATQLEYQVEQQYAVDGVPPEQRKEIVSKVTDVMVDRLKEMSPAQFPDFFRLLHSAFEEKEIVLMSADEKTQGVLEDTGWAGVLNAAESDDQLMIVDANMGALKTDPSVDRHITYSIRPYGSGYRATTTVVYKNNATKSDWRTTRYRSYTRIFAPYLSKLVSSSGTMKGDIVSNPNRIPDSILTTNEFGMTSFGGFTSVELRETHTLSYTYDLPESVVNAIKRGDYTLQVFKQVGARDNLLTLDLDFGTNVTDALPQEAHEDWGDNVYHYETVLDTNKEFRVQF